MSSDIERARELARRARQHSDRVGIVLLARAFHLLWGVDRTMARRTKADLPDGWTRISPRTATRETVGRAGEWLHLHATLAGDEPTWTLRSCDRGRVLERETFAGSLRIGCEAADAAARRRRTK